MVILNSTGIESSFMKIYYINNKIKQFDAAILQLSNYRYLEWELCRISEV